MTGTLFQAVEHFWGVTNSDPKRVLGDLETLLPFVISLPVCFQQDQEGESSNTCALNVANNILHILFAGVSLVNPLERKTVAVDWVPSFRLPDARLCTASEAVAYVHGVRFPLENADDWIFGEAAVQGEDVRKDEKKEREEEKDPFAKEDDVEDVGLGEEEEEEDVEGDEDDDEDDDEWKAVPEWICSTCTYSNPYTDSKRCVMCGARTKPVFSDDD